jgi:hypothetical protein
VIAGKHWSVAVTLLAALVVLTGFGCGDEEEEHAKGYEAGRAAGYEKGYGDGKLAGFWPGYEARREREAGR